MHALSLNVNLVDVLMLCVIVRGYYVGAKSGLISEFFRLTAVICSTFIVVHFYPPLAQFLRDKLFISEKVCEFVAFVICAAVAFLLFFFIREGWLMLFQVERKSVFNRWTGGILSLATSYFVCGLIFLALVLFNNDFVRQQVESSLSRAVWSKTSGKVYKACYGAVVRPFFPGEKINAKMLKFIGEPSGD